MMDCFQTSRRHQPHSADEVNDNLFTEYSPQHSENVPANLHHICSTCHTNLYVFNRPDNNNNSTNSATNPFSRQHLVQAPQFPSKFAIFCESSSVRGMQKIYKSPTKFLKVLWIGFVCLMTILLIVISIYLLIDFRNYHTAWHVTTELDEKTRFPALSICSHNPFSSSASWLWRNQLVLTPSLYTAQYRDLCRQFRRRLFEADAELVRSGKLPSISLLDKADDYYGNVDFNTSIRLGHKREILKYCLMTNDGFTTIAENCQLETDSGFTVTQFSHYNYFNCFTIETKSRRNGFEDAEGDSTNETLALVILVNVNLFADVYDTNASFIMDSLTRGEGLRIVVHEVGSYPDIDKNGINIQPGKMNEVSFQNIYWQRYNTPKRQCDDDQPPIQDLNRRYIYTFTQCLDAQLNAALIKHCNCMNPMWPRPMIPSAEVPYCNNYSANMSLVTRRLDCAYHHVFCNIKKIKANAVGTKCRPRCTFNTYETTLSITRWKPSLTKLDQMTRRYRIINLYHQKVKDLPSNDSALHQLKENFIKELFEEMNFRLNSTDKEPVSDVDEDEVSSPQHRTITHQLNYVSLVRKNFDTTRKIEKLVIDIYIFISRVGGLFSICIGLTTAFFVEIIEFIYLSLKFSTNRSPKPMRQSDAAVDMALGRLENRNVSPSKDLSGQTDSLWTQSNLFSSS